MYRPNIEFRGGSRFVRRRYDLSARATMTSRSTRAKSKSRAPVPRRANRTVYTETGLKSPILGENFKIPDLYSEPPPIELDDTLPYVPVYCHFIIPEIKPIVRPKTPPILTALRAELEEAQTVKSAKTKPEQRSRNTHHNHRQSNKNH